MTTIAYKNGEMACDSSWTHDSGMVLTKKSKITRLSSGGLLGEAGDCDSRAMVALFDKVKSVKQLPSVEQMAATHCDYQAILVLPRGQVVWIEVEKHDQTWIAEAFELVEGIGVCGSGGKCAYGAMAAGKSPKEAVAIACRFDINSRPPVHMVKLHPIQQIKSSHRSVSGHAASDLKVINGGLSRARGSHDKRARRTAACRRRG